MTHELPTSRTFDASTTGASADPFRTVFENNLSVMLIIDPATGSIVRANRAAAAFYGYAITELVAMNICQINTRTLAEINGELSLAAQLGPHRFAFQHRLADGRIRDVEVLPSPVESNGRRLIFSIIQDVTERNRAEQQLRLLANVFNHCGEGILITDADGVIADVNAAFEAITGYSKDEVVGKPARLLKSTRHDQEFFAAMWQSLRQTGQWQGEIWNCRKDAQLFIARNTIDAIRTPAGTTSHYVALFADITDHKEHERLLEFNAHYDGLTGLPNRVLLAERMGQAIAHTVRSGRRFAVAYLDLDNLKVVNDQFGHAAGDDLLQVVARAIAAVLREGDTLARIGGDEFVALLIDVPDQAGCEHFMARILNAAAQPVMICEQSVAVSASLGLTLFPDDDCSAEQLLRHADQAMYQAKLRGKNRYHVFDTGEERNARGHNQLIERIRAALQREEFVLYYQPKIHLPSGALVGVEALIRWQSPEHGLLAPAAFLPAIEADSLAITLGEWVIDTALTQSASWKAQGLQVPISVNVGARQLNEPDFMLRLTRILDRHPGCAAGQLEIEVLETSALADLHHVSQIIGGCRKLGVDFSLDDFGTGYSSLTHLKHLDVSWIKIDRSFVSDMLHDANDLAILKGVIGLAAAFRRNVIAEGVENAEQAEALMALGCEHAQGYWIARPMPAAALFAWVATRAAAVDGALQTS